jgi:DNA repair exonuclease SbcCD ATPase subunit
MREAIDTKLDKWEASATAVETQLQQTKEQALEELEARKKRLNETLEEFKSEVAKAKGLSDEKKTEIQARFEDLQVQLALGKAEARDAFEAQKEKIQRSIATLETTIDRELDAAGQSIDESLRKTANRFIAAAIGLEADMEALEVQFEVKKAGAMAQFEHVKRELVAQIKQYKDRLQETKQMAKDKAATFENELSDGMSQIKQAFKKLFD